MGPALACPTTEPSHVRMEQGRAGDMGTNLARYDLVSIRLAVVCAETGSLSEAARLLHMSLSGASHRLSSLEEALGLERGRIGFEIQVETPQLILGHDGRIPVVAALHAGGGRVTSLHYGTYDYSVSLGVSAEYQSPMKN